MNVDLRAIVARHETMRDGHNDRGALLDLLRRIADADPLDSEYPYCCHYCLVSFFDEDAKHEPNCPYLVLEALRSVPGTTLLPEQSRQKGDPAMKIELNADEVRAVVCKDLESQGMVVESVKTGKNGSVVVEGHRPPPTVTAVPNVGTETLEQKDG